MRKIKDRCPQRKPLRLKDYDYGQVGAYFVTICVKGHKTILGNIVENVEGKKVCELTDLGEIIEQEWNALFDYYEDMDSDIFQIMPNHVHGIVWITAKQKSSLGDVIARFKSLTTKRCKDIKQLDKSLWQKNYYEHVIRDEKDLRRVQEYIMTNPDTWDKDSYFVFERQGLDL